MFSFFLHSYILTFLFCGSSGGSFGGSSGGSLGSPPAGSFNFTNI